MPVSENLAVQHHQQDTDYYCGAACAQMVLETIGAGILDQDDLYADNHSHSTLDSGVNWATGPDGLQWTMNDRRPPAFTNSFVLFALGTEEAISRKICWTIRHYQVGPIALVYGWAHWIVIRGYTASAHPASSADNSYTISAFDLNNPWPPTPSFYTPASAPPPPHAAADGCGTGGDRGVANEHITYATWQSTYMTGVPGGFWNGKFVAVCDPEPPPLPGGPRPPAPDRPSSNEILRPEVAAKLAVAGMKQYGLYERKDWGRALRQAEAQPGLLVQRLDRLDSYYWLVPLRGPRGTVALASVDGRRGNYRQSVLLPKARGDFFRIGPKEALKRIVGQRIELGSDQGRLLVREQALSLYPHLVWRPCRESLSPYYPFYMFTIGRRRLYVRVDGAIFTSLTLDQKGI
ncbi:MAG: hypothetical protein ACJ759_12735 [Thermoanaerobaculia bacterium]